MLGRIADFQRRLLRWYEHAHRTLPWRAPAGSAQRPDAYHVLVSELMLQQTQVATVIPYFQRFLARFPTLGDLAVAEEQDVLRLWQGLGYYSRARNLQRAARRVVAEHDGVIPARLDELLELPGVGRYTAGAIASIAYGKRTPILDGNVIRVLCRIDKITDDPRSPPVRDLLWERAEAILPARRTGDFNSALMELGATVCTPRGPQCLTCPVRDHCAAREAGMQEGIPQPKKARPTPLEHRVVFCIRREDRWLIEQRPASGRWAGMWQFVTRPMRAGSRRRCPALPVPAAKPRALGRLRHALTHRRYEFDVRWYVASDDAAPALEGRPFAWVSLDGLSAYPLPRPHLRVAEMLRELA